eukprot:TRINITY_DN11593_c0_g1_i1.p2 TRINITY_DN11593_c0_g1~~TRINITY_DN11593_c0_g1_i1.p2  ORF type:complete len:108 (-),score=4.47 TRINITY_DN11593_c0_g1_i1:19-342(-)
MCVCWSSHAWYGVLPLQRQSKHCCGSWSVLDTCISPQRKMSSSSPGLGWAHVAEMLGAVRWKSLCTAADLATSDIRRGAGCANRTSTRNMLFLLLFSLFFLFLRRSQ